MEVIPNRACRAFAARHVFLRRFLSMYKFSGAALTGGYLIDWFYVPFVLPSHARAVL